MASFQAVSWLNEHDMSKLADGVSGYILGFGAAFAGWVAVHLIKGGGAKFIDTNPIFKWVSVFTLMVIALFGLAGFAIDVFGDTSWQFNLGFVAGGFVMSTCFGPVIDAVA